MSQQKSLESYQIEVLYHHSKDLIRLLVENLQRKTGSDISDLLSEAHEVFIDCFYNFDPEKSSFNTYLTRCINWRLINTWRRSIIEKRIINKMGTASKELYENDCCDLQDHNEAVPCWFDLSQDAWSVIKIAMRSAWIFRRMSGKGKKEMMKQKTKNILLRKGWLRRDIRKAFREIREVMQ